MSDTLIAVLIGAAISIIPTVFISVFQFIGQNRQQEFQIKLERTKIYEASRKEALESFMYHLGAMVSDRLPPDKFTPANYFAAAKKACIYVSPDTAKLIETVNKLVDGNWNAQNHYTYLLDSNEFIALNQAISYELSVPINDGACRNNAK
ncbi:hypothetical protein [Gehongia tenuis]|uniref:Uncharacterized protein n=1 Tax=Gehongia tenuis TaxID=2763655 RepID=A0A926HQ22_9FIRM|nr:hypothetical protein [Gehongia tenuis]MBC8531783.1 hypothetical protein [Gehongia tenuis]